MTHDELEKRVLKVTITQDPELTQAADSFLLECESKAIIAGEVNGIQLWNQWVIRWAFERGVAWQQSREGLKT